MGGSTSIWAWGSAWGFYKSSLVAGSATALRSLVPGFGASGMAQPCARPGRRTRWHCPWSWEPPCSRLAVPAHSPPGTSLPPSLRPSLLSLPGQGGQAASCSQGLLFSSDKKWLQEEHRPRERQEPRKGGVGRSLPTTEGDSASQGLACLPGEAGAQTHLPGFVFPLVFSDVIIGASVCCCFVC